MHPPHSLIHNKWLQGDIAKPQERGKKSRRQEKTPVAAQQVFDFLHEQICKLCSPDLPAESLPAAAEGYSPFIIITYLSQKFLTKGHTFSELVTFFIMYLLILLLRNVCVRECFAVLKASSVFCMNCMNIPFAQSTSYTYVQVFEMCFNLGDFEKWDGISFTNRKL